MKDYKHLDREGLMKVLGEGDEPKAGILWRGLEKVVATLGFLLLCFVVLWAMGAWVASGIELVLMGRSVTWVLLFFSIALMAGGAYWLERLDDGDS